MSKATQNARRFGGKPYGEMIEMLTEEKPDGVIICIGPHEHARLAAVVMRLGIPVYTEKPPAPDAHTALELARISRETGVLCSVAFKKRYNNAYSRAKEWLEQFDQNDWYSISVNFAGSAYGTDAPVDSCLCDMGIHVIDLVSYLFWDARRVFAFAKGHDAFAVSIAFANGAVGSLNLNCGRSLVLPTEEVEITVRGGNFMTIHNSSSWRIAEDGQAVQWREPPTFVSAGDSGFETGHLAEIVDFISAVRECRTTRSNIFESYKTLVFREGIQRSAETQEAVELQYHSS